MINQQAILEWSKDHSWQSKSFVEQDLIICRAIVEIFSDPFLAQELAWRGGTALHKLYLKPQARYSEDIDLVQIHPGPIKPIVERLDKALVWLPGKGILRPDIPFDAHSAYGRIRHSLIDKLMTAKDLESVNKQNKKQ